MSETVLVPVPGIGVLALAPDAFRAALAEGAQLAAVRSAEPAAPAASEVLLDSAQLAAALGVPATWVEQSAREGRIPSIRCGRYVRFSRAAVEAALTRSGS